MEEFAEWLRRHNGAMPASAKVGFYGLDVYSLWESALHPLHLEVTDTKEVPETFPSEV